MIRPFVEEDIESVSRLRLGAFGAESSAPLPILREQFRQVFFESPWHTPSIPSLVWEDSQGTITGFVGVVPRPMTFRGERIQAVVATQLMTSPQQADPFVAARLVHEVLRSGYALVLSDGATTASAQLMERCRARRIWLQSQRWIRNLRPVREFTRTMGRTRPWLRTLAKVGTPVIALADGAFARVSPNRFHRPSRFQRSPISASGLWEGTQHLFDDTKLRMEYDEASLTWILARLSEKRRHGRLEGAILRDGDGLAGWYIYNLHDRKSRSEVVQVAARRGLEEAVISDLMSAAWKKGATALRGPMDAAMAVPLIELHARFRIGAPWTLCHTERDDLRDALCNGEAQLSRLDMEYWQRFTGG